MVAPGAELMDLQDSSRKCHRDPPLIHHLVTPLMAPMNFFGIFSVSFLFDFFLVLSTDFLPSPIPYPPLIHPLPTPYPPLAQAFYREFSVFAQNVIKEEPSPLHFCKQIRVFDFAPGILFFLVGGPENL